MGADTMTEQTIKTAGGQTLGIGAGNASAYALLEFLSWKYDYVPADPVVFVAMVGTLLGILALQLGNVVRGTMGVAKYVFDRIFPDKRG